MRVKIPNFIFKGFLVVEYFSERAVWHNFACLNKKFIHMKRLGYPLALVFVSLVFVVFFTTITAVTFASYSKSDKGSSVIKERLSGFGATVRR